jgi:hypothetical protein
MYIFVLNRKNNRKIRKNLLFLQLFKIQLEWQL